MNERRFVSRRRLGPIALGGTAFVLSSLLGRDSDDYLEDLKLEDRYHRFVNNAAFRCAGTCGERKLPFSLAFDQNYRLVVPGLATAGLPGTREGGDIRFLEMIANGEIPPPPLPVELKSSRPEWSKEVLLSPVFKGPSDRPLVALTVDDGYFNRNEILDTLIREDVSATFLIIGSVMDSDPSFIKRAQESGKITWGNHTYTHGDLTRKSVPEIRNELARTEASLKRIAGATTIPLMRPPGGSRNSASITAAADAGFRTFMWNVSGDAGGQWTASNPEALVNYYMGLLDRQVNPWGSIILTHFRPATSAALPSMIREIRKRGMEPVSLDRLYESGRV